MSAFLGGINMDTAEVWTQLRRLGVQDLPDLADLDHDEIQSMSVQVPRKKLKQLRRARRTLNKQGPTAFGLGVLPGDPLNWMDKSL